MGGEREMEEGFLGAKVFFRGGSYGFQENEIGIGRFFTQYKRKTTGN